LVTIHARSRACHFKGVVDYPAVARITRAVSIPVLVNGDITTAAEARLALHNSCAAGVMVGRGAIGQPWIFRELDGKPKPDYHERWAVVLEHVQSIHEFYGQQPGLQIARKHIVAYANLLGFDVRACLRLERPEQQLKWLNEARDRMSERQKNYEHHSERAQAA
jgi:tRNA-dihydrouridine synthase B